LHIVIIPQNVKQEGFNAESGHQGLNVRKNPREETTSSDEQDLHLKGNEPLELSAMQAW